jgi:hypothetical protein
MPTLRDGYVNGALTTSKPLRKPADQSGTDLAHWLHRLASQANRSLRNQWAARHCQRD